MAEPSPPGRATDRSSSDLAVDQLPPLPPLPARTRIRILKTESGGDEAGNPADIASVLVELPSGGRRQIRRVITCLAIVAGMCAVPIIGAWYFFVYRDLMPGPVEGAPTAVSVASSGAAPGWYSLLMTLSITFISAIFVFTAMVFFADAMHILYGRTRMLIDRTGIDVIRLLGRIRLRLGERSIPAEDITRVQVRPDAPRAPGSVRITVVRQPIDIAEEVDLADREWIAEAIGMYCVRREVDDP